MEEESTEQLIKEHIGSLPQPVKEAIASFDWARTVFDIGRANGLHVDKVGDLETEVMLVILGLVSPEDFKRDLSLRIVPDKSLAEKVSEEVNEKVFLRIRDFMKNYYESEEKSGEAISGKEKRLLNNVGISLGNDPDYVASEKKEPVVVAPVDDSDDELLSLAGDIPEASTQNTETIKPAPEKKLETVASPVKTESPAAVFKTKVREVSAEGKPQNFFDPYREPLG